MHLVINELLSPEQLSSSKRYIYQMCEMYGWEYPDDVFTTRDGYSVSYAENNIGKAKKRQRLIRDACTRLGTEVLRDRIDIADDCYLVYSTIPFYNSK